MFVTNKFVIAVGLVAGFFGRAPESHYLALTLDRTHVTAGTKTGLTGVVSAGGNGRERER
ncbi:hypothetical protein BJ998_008668 [Kutzneria kofuensis]|uniref:Uncharacterized protein n=1 Tax=Kutzneria kofuensis TaxID=103725 RepID=A0A7W9KT19_9PSEU|nr:hypothetical protein [Kutzneria kofuensis]